MRSASVGSLNFARGMMWSISTSLGWSGFPLLSQSGPFIAQIVPLRRITSSRRSAHPCLSWVSAPEAFVPDEFLSYYCLFCGIGIVPGFGQ